MKRSLDIARNKRDSPGARHFIVLQRQFKKTRNEGINVSVKSIRTAGRIRRNDQRAIHSHERQHIIIRPSQACFSRACAALRNRA